MQADLERRSIFLGLGSAVLERAVGVAVLGWVARRGHPAAADGAMFAALRTRSLVAPGVAHAMAWALLGLA